MTKSQLKQLQYDNAQGNEPEKIDGNMPAAKNWENGDKKPKGYKLPKHEAHMMHVSLCMPGHDQQSGKKLHKPYVQQYYPDQFVKMEKSDHFVGLEVEVLHDPRKSEAKSAPSTNNKGGLLDKNIPEIVTEINQMSDVEALKKVQAQEQSGKKRKGVLDPIQARIEELSAGSGQPNEFDGKTDDEIKALYKVKFNEDAPESATREELIEMLSEK